MNTAALKVYRCIMIIVVATIVFFATGPAFACTWDPIVNKCHPAAGEVVVYKHNECNGTQYYSFNGNNQVEYPDFTQLQWPDGTSLNDSVSCYVIGHKTTFKYFQHINFKGKSVTEKNKASDSMKQKKLGGTWWNDTISSARVFRD